MTTHDEPCPLCYIPWAEKEHNSIEELLEEIDWWNPECTLCYEGWIKVIDGE